jgi:hypothetical protein
MALNKALQVTPKPRWALPHLNAGVKPQASANYLARPRLGANVGPDECTAAGRRDG